MSGVTGTGPLVDEVDGGARRRDVLAASFLIAAMDEGRVIGHSGAIPWRQRADMRHFRNATLGCALVVGRTTFDALPASMPGRDVIVVTSRPLPEDATALAAIDFDDAVRIALDDTSAMAIAFAGGPRIYEEALRAPWLRRAVVTMIEGRRDGDALMPPLGEDWTATSRTPLESREGEPAAEVVAYAR